MATVEPSSLSSITYSSSQSHSTIVSDTTVPNATSTTALTFVLDTNLVFSNAILATNAISVAACLFVIIVYIFLRRKSPKMMARTSLKLSIAMACTDLIYHATNLAGYGDLPDGFVCAFVGGWLFAITSMLSVFYSTSIALNTQLVFVHKRIPPDNKQIYFLTIPPMIAFGIATPSLIAGVYGFDEVFEYCWYATRNVPSGAVRLRVFFTWVLWLSLAVLYLFVAVIVITYSLFSRNGLLAGVGTRYMAHQPSLSHTESVSNANAALAATLARRDTARRALTVRVLGYIIVPIICVFPGVVNDTLARARPGIQLPPLVTTIAGITAGLMGTCNAILLSFDPSVVAVVFSRRLQKKMQKARRRAVDRDRERTSRHKPQVLADDIEMGDSKVVPDEQTQRVVVTTIRLDPTDDDDNGLEYHGHLAVQDTSDNTPTSTIGYDFDDLAEIYHGL